MKESALARGPGLAEAWERVDNWQLAFTAIATVLNSPLAGPEAKSTTLIWIKDLDPYLSNLARNLLT
jgi:hypothetical protein